jgi:hypothetical protein
MPYALISLLESFFNMDLYSISPLLVQLPCLMAKTACIWNPLVYVCHNNQFRKAFIKRYGIEWIFATKTSSDPDTSESGGNVLRLRGQEGNGLNGLETHV